MKRIFLFFIFVLFLSSWALAQKGVVVTPRNMDHVEGGRWAFIVAVNDYGEIRNLNYTVNDAQDLKDRLVEMGFDDENIVLLSSGGLFRDLPTKDNIERRWKSFLTRLGPKDMVIVYLSGHGVMISGKEGSFFCPPDTSPGDLAGTTVSINGMMDDLADCPAKFKWMVVDACRNDPKNPGKGIFTTKDAGALGRELESVLDPPNVVTLLQSCQPKQVSFEGGVGSAKDIHNGFFTISLLESMSSKGDANGDGDVTFSEIFQYVSRRTNDLAARHYGKTQQPNLSGNITDFVLFRCKKQTEKTTITVPTDVPTLAEAYEKVAPGGAILLKRGVHKVPKTVTITKDITITGDVKNPEYVVLQGGEKNVFHLQFGFAEIAGMTILNEGKKGSGLALNDAVQFSAPLGALHDCVFTSAYGRGFIVNTKDSNPNVKNCVARNCGGSGFYIAGGASGTFRNCTASGNAYSGMEVQDAQSNPMVEDCRFSEGKSAGVLVLNGASGTFRNCTASGNAYSGMEVSDAQSNPMVEDCRFTDGKQSGILVLNGASGTFRNCTASGNARAGMDIQGAQSNPTVEDYRFTDGKSVGIFVFDGASGTFRNCTASGNAGAGMVVQYAQSNPTVEDCRFNDGKRAGIIVWKGASGTFRNCTASGNAFAGMVVRDAQSNPTVEDCRFTDGKIFGIYVGDGASGTFRNCTASGNERPGMVVRDAQSNPMVEECRFTEGKSAGIAIGAGASGTFWNCTASGNALAGMVVQDAQSNPTVEGCTFEKNWGNGVRVYDGASGTFRRNILSRNSMWYDNWDVSGASSDLVREGNTPNR